MRDLLAVLWRWESCEGSIEDGGFNGYGKASSLGIGATVMEQRRIDNGVFAGPEQGCSSSGLACVYQLIVRAGRDDDARGSSAMRGSGNFLRGEGEPRTREGDQTAILAAHLDAAAFTRRG